MGLDKCHHYIQGTFKFPNFTLKKSNDSFNLNYSKLTVVEASSHEEELSDLAGLSHFTSVSCSPTAPPTIHTLRELPGLHGHPRISSGMIILNYSTLVQSEHKSLSQLAIVYLMLVWCI